ncbi:MULTISPECIES: hypothetical protein [unclassified Paracoccus (in: a-proteobacteria)]|uniref:hypothetical protein n=1 Tax=unclassified Paracoccus (in: a-proteobacteria) TaxID=2688777 RepID=UPI001C096C85|nr:MULTISPECIES: hypothetical protein [unclassified Paracoccus (in: a-proteobacteria)]MBU2957156.1 hypothetical protein [Paracoccus sp. C2R09]
MGELRDRIGLGRTRTAGHDEEMANLSHPWGRPGKGCEAVQYAERRVSKRHSCSCEERHHLRKKGKPFDEKGKLCAVKYRCELPLKSSFPLTIKQGLSTAEKHRVFLVCQ